MKIIKGKINIVMSRDDQEVKTEKNVKGTRTENQRSYTQLYIRRNA